MGQFDIVRARPKLGFTPSSAVRSNIDTSDVGTGAALGQAVVGAGRMLIAIRDKRQQMTDANSAVTADANRATSDAEFRAWKAVNPQETWEVERQRRNTAVGSTNSKLNFSSSALQREQTRQRSYSQVGSAKALTDATFQLRTDTIDALTANMTAAYASGDSIKIEEATNMFEKNAANMGKDANEVLNDKKVAESKGDKIRANNSANDVYAAIELASDTSGDFATAKELAKNPTIPESRQATLRSAINTAEEATKRETEEKIKKVKTEATSDALRGYFQNNLTVSELDKKHEAGLIENSEFKFMRQGLVESIPKNSDPQAAGIIRRANADFEAGLISKGETEKIIGENYAKLDGTDRSNVFSDIEDVATKIIGTAKKNAYDEGRSLMSAQFVGIQTQDDLSRMVLGITGLTDEEKTRLNRRFEAEVSNRDLYERAVTDRFREMRKEGVSDTKKFESESLRILLTYNRRKRLNLEQLEGEVQRGQFNILKANKPVKASKSIKDMTTEEKQTELQKIRDLKRLAK